jgi:hypothetical protein
VVSGSFLCLQSHFKVFRPDKLGVLNAGVAPKVHYFDTYFIRKLRRTYDEDKNTNVHKNTNVKKLKYSILDSKKWVVPINQVTSVYTAFSFLTCPC